MDGMKTNTTNLLRMFSGLSLGLVLTAGAASAQNSATPNNSAKSTETQKTEKVTETTKAAPKKKADAVTSATTGEDAGNYTITSSIEFGYRGQRVDGDVNKFKSDLNYKA